MKRGMGAGREIGASRKIGAGRHGAAVSPVRVLLVMVGCWAGMMGVAPPASAHHSFAVYDQTKKLVVKGAIKTFQWTNPHVIVWVLVTPDKGGEPAEWSFETTSPGVLTRSGWTRHSLNPGDAVSLEYFPLRDGSHGGGVVSVTLLATGQKLTANFAAQEKPGLQ